MNLKSLNLYYLPYSMSNWGKKKGIIISKCYLWKRTRATGNLKFSRPCNCLFQKTTLEFRVEKEDIETCSFLLPHFSLPRKERQEVISD